DRDSGDPAAHQSLFHRPASGTGLYRRAESGSSGPSHPVRAAPSVLGVLRETESHRDPSRRGGTHPPLFESTGTDDDPAAGPIEIQASRGGGGLSRHPAA